MNDIKTFKSLCVSSAKNAYLAAHNRNVCSYSAAIATKLKLPEKMCEVICYAAFYHDIGKIGVPNSILFKQGQLTNEEWKIMKLHPVTGAELLSNEDIEIKEAVRHHHERWDGKGYPDGLIAEEIPLAAQIIAVADAFDAMTTDRPYRNAMDKNNAAAELARCAGKQFNPEVVNVFLGLFTAKIS